MSNDPLAAELLAVNQQLLESIVQGDWAAYARLCHPGLTCFEPETRGNLVEGMAFHRFYFELGSSGTPVNVSMSMPHVRVIGDAAVLSYVRITQRLGADGSPVSVRCEETRVWQRIDGQWRHVHFHRSSMA